MPVQRSTSGPARTLGLIALFVLGFSATATLQRSALVPNFGLGSGLKLEVFRQDRDGIDLLYLGSSHFAHGIDPRVIDPIVRRKLERPFRSFNLALAGTRGLEVDYLIRWLLHSPPARLRWLVIEAPTFDGRIPERWRNLSVRMAYWHSARQTRIALAQLAVDDMPPEEARKLALFHLRLYAVRATNLGLGEEIFRWILDRRSPEVRRQIDGVRALHGYASLEALEGRGGPLAETRRMFRERPEDFARALDRFRPDAVEPAYDDYPVEVLAAQIRFLESRGITPIYVAPPTLKPAGVFRELARRGDLSHLLVYSDPERHPDLYRLSSRWDTHHTSEAGTRLWSETLADDLVRLIRSLEAAP